MREIGTLKGKTMKSLKSVAALRLRLRRAGERYGLLMARHSEALSVADAILREQYATGEEMRRLGREIYEQENGKKCQRQ